MNLSEDCRFLLNTSRLLVEDRLQRGDDLAAAHRWVARNWGDLADKLKHGASARVSEGGVMYMSPGVRVHKESPTTFDSAPPRAYASDLRTVADIERLRAVIAELGRTVKPDGIIANVKMKRQQARKLLGWLAREGEYDGWTRRTPRRYKKTAQ